MADDPGDDDILRQVIIIIVVIFFILSALTGYGVNVLSNSGGEFDWKNFSLSSAFPVGTISLGDDIINKKDLDVFRVPARQIIGTQPKREVGKPIEGPVELNGYTWWRIDYPNAPDGWVKQSKLSDYVWGYRAVNIFPIVFGALTPFLILISIILFILIIVVTVKTNRLYELKQKKLELKLSQTLPQKISEEVEREKEKARDDKVESNEDGSKTGGDENNSLFDILPTGDTVPETQDVHNRRWSKVETLINSHSVNDWKQAIIEADIILDEMLDKMGYKGDSIGDKLKTIEPSDFLTLNQAWEAHKIRNRIAHKGSDYTLSRDDAERAFNLYKEVFEEFYFI